MALSTLIVVGQIDGDPSEDVKKALFGKGCLYIDVATEFTVYKTTKRVFKGILVHDVQVSLRDKKFPDALRAKRFWASFPVGGEDGKVGTHYLELSNKKTW